MKPRYLYFRGNSNFPYKFYKKVLFLLLVLLVSTNTLISQPNIRVSGNGVIIENGDQTPNTNDQTDFGAVYSSSGSVYRFFKIENTGNSPLILSDSKLRIEGENPGDFELLNLDYVSPIINPGSYLTVRIDFDPKGNGIRKATAVIENNDPDDNPFIFTIQGNGLEPFQDPNGIFTDINAEIQGVGSDGSYIGRSSSDWGDYDNDGDLDFVITGFSFRGFKTKIYKNEGNNIFTDINADIVQTGRSCVKWGDYDNDNDLDLIVTGLGSGMNGQRTIIYRNDGYDIFIQAAAIIGLEHSSASWGDYDNDGDLDILVAGHSSSGSITNIYKNVGNDSFTAISANIAAVNWGGAEWGDFDNDSDLDLAIIGQNSYGYNDPILKVYRNNGNGNFTDINTNLTDLAYSFITWGDYDSDGDLDLAVTGDNNSISYSIIYRNDGGNIFTNINAGLPGVKDGAIKFGDYDNDGDLDLVLTGTTNQSSLTTITSVFENKGADIFNKKTELISLRNSSVSWGDYDSDGDLDLISTGDVENYQVTKIYNNSSATANTKPNPPINLQTEVNGSSVLLKWDKSSDNESAQNSLTYNIYIGSAAGAVDVVSPMSKISDGTRRIAQIG
ncbi:MAG: FG-GAP-like repeat-containing protein, partial [Ignavibacteria bacterium]